MIKHLKPKNKYRLLLAFYISLSIIIIMFVFSIVLTCVYRISKNNIMQINSLSAQMLKKEIDSQISSMHNIYKGIINDYDVFLAMNISGPYEKYKLTQELNTYVLINQNLSDIAILDFENNTVFSSLGSATITEYVQTFMNFNINTDEVLKNISSIHDVHLTGFYTVKSYNSDKEQNVALYIMSISKFKKLVFLIPESVFKKPVEIFIGNFNSKLQLISQNNEEIVSVNINNGINFSPSPDKIETKQMYGISVGEYKNHYLITTPSEVSPYKYRVISNSDKIMKNMNQLQLLFFISTLIIIIIGCIISWFFSGFAYRPIYKLKSFFGDQNNNEKNEFQLIINHFQQLQVKLNTAQSNLQIRNKYIFENLVSTLLSNSAFYKNHKNLYDENNIIFDMQNIQVMSISSDDLSYQEIIAFFKDNDEIKVYPSFNNEYTMIVLIINYNDRSVFEKTINQLTDSLNNKGLEYAIGISEICESVYDISSKFSQSLTALGCCNYDQNIKVCNFKEQKDQYQVDINKFDLIKLKLIESIKGCDIETVQTLLHQLFDLSESTAFYNFAYANLISLLQIIAQSIGYKNDNIKNLIYITDKNKDIKEKMYLEVVIDMCKEIDKSKCIVKDKFINEIYQFIKENYSNNNLSVEYVADHFNVSVSYLNKYAKKVSGNTVFSIIDLERTEQAKKMITQTDLSINEISERCGYTDPNYFIKKLKKATGLTPTQYREYYKNL